MSSDHRSNPEKENDRPSILGPLLLGLVSAAVSTIMLERERIRRVQNDESKYKKAYESRWCHGPGAYQHYQRDDWYWKTDTSYGDQRTNFQSAPNGSGNFALSPHYSVLGLDRFRTKPYSDAEIKAAFRAKALECHPDQNQSNKEAAEAKFKEVMMSYEAIQSEKKNGWS